MVQGVKIVEGSIVDENPANGEVIARVKVSTESEVNTIVSAAKAAQPKWAACDLKDRVAIMKRAVKRLATDKVELAKLITREMGKILRESEEEVEGAANKDSYLDLVEAANRPVERGNCVVTRQAHGVVAVLSPWNYPVDEILLLALPALVAGNAVVVKPSEVAPLSGERSVSCLIDELSAEGHTGLVGLLQGDGAVGKMLVAHPDIALIGMTGSCATGSNILKAASDRLKRVVLELGGKDPMVVLEDADLELAAEDAVTFSLANCGQVCCAVERVYVAESVSADFEQRVLARASKYVAGDGLEPGTSIGPLVSQMQRTTVHAHVESAKAAGARVLLGGDLPPSEAEGNFYPPTVLADVPHASKITREETFGPVVALTAFDGSEETAVALANDSEYGLTASVYTKDAAKGARLAARLRAGQVGINNNPFAHADEGCPWVGHRMSGYGYHSGEDGWRQFSVPKSIVHRTGA
jgi:succinate-semialdehyde dehydrogenase/glutarate-semialdehyde dehydrogenase